MRGLWRKGVRALQDRVLPSYSRSGNAVLFAFLLITAGACWAMTRFRFEPDIATFYPKEDPTFDLMKRAYGDSPPTRLLVVVLRSDGVEKLEAALPDVVRSLQGSPHVLEATADRDVWFGRRSEWIGRSPLYFLPEESRERLKSHLVGPLGRNALGSIKQRIADDPVGGTQVVLADPLEIRWVLEDARRRHLARFPASLKPDTPHLIFDRAGIALVRVIGREEWTNLDFSRLLVEDVGRRLSATLPDGRVRSELAGAYVTALFAVGRANRDLAVLGLVATVLILGFTVWMTRSFLAAVCINVPVLLCIFWTLAFGGLFLGPLTPLTAGLAGILMGQIDFPIHIWSRYRQERLTSDKEEALRTSLFALGRAMVGASITTVVGFAVLLASGFPGIRQLGVLLCLGLFLSLIASWTLFPVLLLKLDARLKGAAPGEPFLVSAAARISRSRARFIAAALLGVVGAASWIVVARVGVNVDLEPRNIAPPGDPGDRVFARLERDLGISLLPVFVLLPETTPVDRIRSGIEPLEKSGTAGWSDGPHALFPSAEARAQVARFHEDTRGWVQGALLHLTTLGLKPDRFRKTLEEWDTLFRREAAGMESLQLREFADVSALCRIADEGRSYWKVRLCPRQSLISRPDRAAFDQAVKQNLGGEVRLLGEMHIPDHYAHVLREDLFRLGTLAGLGMMAVCLVAVGRAGHAARALLPAAVSTGFVFAAASLGSGAINLVNIIAIPLVIGTAVDDGMFLVGYFKERPEARSDEAIRQVGPPLWGSAVTMILGFASFLFSVSPGLASMGFLVASSRAVALLAALLIVPVLRPDPARVP